MSEEKKWVCVHCNKVMGKSNFEDFIKESDNDKNSNQEAVVEYHHWIFCHHHHHQREKKWKMFTLVTGSLVNVS